MELARLLYLFHYSIIRASLLTQLVNKESACNAKDPSWILGSGRSAGEGIGYPLQFSWMSPVAQLVMNQPTVQETWVPSLDWKDPLEKGNGYIHQYSGLENSKDREAWQDTVQFSSVQKLRRVQLCATPWTAACQASLSITYHRVHSNSCPLSQWYHPTISFSVIPISSCFQSFPASGSLQMSQFFTSSSQSIGVSASASVFPMNIQDYFL